MDKSSFSEWQGGQRRLCKLGLMKFNSNWFMAGELSISRMNYEDDRRIIILVFQSLRRKKFKKD